MKKILSILLLLAMLLSVASVAAAEEAIVYDGSEVTINFYHTMDKTKEDLLNAYIAEFNTYYPNIHITHGQVGGYDDVRDQISKEIPEGIQPNIAYCYPDHVALYNLAKAVQTLDAFIESDAVVTRADGTTEIVGLTAEQEADFIEGYYAEGRQFGDGMMYSLPFSKSTEVLYYNKTFFEEHNLALPQTWEDMGKLCEQIVEIDPMSIPLGYDSESNWFITMCEQAKIPYTSATAPHFLFDNDEAKEFVKMFRDWYQEGYLTTQGLYKAYTSGLFVSTNETKSYMSIGSSAGATHQRPAKVNNEYPFEVGITTIPQVDANNKKVISHGPSLCILKNENPQEVAASWLFVKFMTTNVAFQAEFAMASGYVPVIKSVSENEVYADFINSADGGDFIAALSAKVCLEQADYYYTSPAFNGSSTARSQVGPLMTKCFNIPDGSDVDAQIDAAFADAIAECEYSIGW